MAAATTTASPMTMSLARGTRTAEIVIGRAAAVESCGRGFSTLAPLGERYRLSRFRPDVLRLRADDAVVRALLQHVGGPARHTRHCEGGWEIFLRQPDRLQHARRVKLDVGRLWPLGVFLVKDLQRRLLDLGRELVELGVEPRAHCLE